MGATIVLRDNAKLNDFLSSLGSEMPRLGLDALGGAGGAPLGAARRARVVQVGLPLGDGGAPSVPAVPGSRGSPSGCAPVSPEKPNSVHPKPPKLSLSTIPLPAHACAKRTREDTEETIALANELASPPSKLPSNKSNASGGNWSKPPR